MYKTLTLEKLKEALVDAGTMAASVMFLLGCATVFGRLLTLRRIPEQLAGWMLAVSSNPVVIMLFLLVSGMFIDTTSNIVLFAALFCPSWRGLDMTSCTLAC